MNCLHGSDNLLGDTWGKPREKRRRKVCSYWMLWIAFMVAIIYCGDAWGKPKEKKKMEGMFILNAINFMHGKVDRTLALGIHEGNWKKKRGWGLFILNAMDGRYGGDDCILGMCEENGKKNENGRYSRTPLQWSHWDWRFFTFISGSPLKRGKTPKKPLFGTLKYWPLLMGNL